MDRKEYPKASRHVDGIRYIKDKHKIGLRMDCQDVGKYTKTVPYDKLTDCDIEEPAGAAGPCCCMVPHTVSSCGKVGVALCASCGEIWLVIFHLPQNRFRDQRQMALDVSPFTHCKYCHSG